MAEEPHPTCRETGCDIVQRAEIVGKAIAGSRTQRAFDRSPKAGVLVAGSHVEICHKG